MPDVLIVEDQPAVASALRVLLEIDGLTCAVAPGPAAALQMLASQSHGVVIQDMNFSPGQTSGEEGIDLFRRLRALDPEIPVLLVTAWTSLETAVRLTREGASDYLAKPWDDEKLLATVRNLLALRGLQMENRRLRGRGASAREELAGRHDLCGAVYASHEMHAVVSLAVQVARAAVPVMITGPSGAGKEKLAEIIHANSARAAGPLIKVNAGAIPEELMESELFGAEAGAYTDARRRRIGRFEAAHGGTLFLDEIGNLPASGQRKLLRVIQSGEFERLGSSTTIAVDLRIVCATNADMRAEIAAGRFREDLYFRLNVIELAVPPLGSRPEDVLPLAEHFLSRLAPPEGAPRRLGAEARRALLEHPWPGNVRELSNRVHRALLVAQQGEIGPADLGLAAPSATLATRAPSPAGDEEAAERVRIERALVDAEGNVSRAAAALGLSRQALYRRMERLGIAMERRPRG
ncbi:MAG TPA: sigma-54 dependent transcriptional regulator [Candidatus Polarisedimenticolia bacterium]|nr:sigma-54 dependent transcriptional regulator [Candidatus Polarisedimenticolia bacterium]